LSSTVQDFNPTPGGGKVVADDEGSRRPAIGLNTSQRCIVRESLMGGEPKELAAEQIANVLEDHKERRAALGSLEEEFQR